MFHMITALFIFFSCFSFDLEDTTRTKQTSIRGPNPFWRRHDLSATQVAR
jgi:hypothetical protein